MVEIYFLKPPKLTKIIEYIPIEYRLYPYRDKICNFIKIRALIFQWDYIMLITAESEGSRYAADHLTDDLVEVIVGGPLHIDFLGADIEYRLVVHHKTNVCLGLS